MKIDNIQKITDFKGKAVKVPDGELTVGEAISNILLTDKTGGKYKAYILAQKFATEDSVSLDAADASLLKKAIEADGYYAGNLISGFLLSYLETLNDKKD